MEFTIALDLEGTLVSSQVSRLHRPGLYDFLEACRELGRVVIYTAVDEETSREIVRGLCERKKAPEWFVDVLWVGLSDAGFKDLNLIPEAEPISTVIVDDHRGFIKPGQEDQWVQIMFFDPTTPDDEFDHVLWRLKRAYKKIMGKPVDLTWPGDKNQKINELQDEIDDLTLENISLQAEKDKLIQIINDSEEK